MRVGSESRVYPDVVFFPLYDLGASQITNMYHTGNGWGLENDRPLAEGCRLQAEVFVLFSIFRPTFRSLYSISYKQPQLAKKGILQ